MNKKFQVMLTYDVDAETLWTAPDPLNDARNHLRPTMMSQAAYGPKVAVPRILKLLDDFDIKGSFFIPGATVVKYPEMVAEIHKRGHEVANHGYTHICPDEFTDRDAEMKEYVDTNEAIKKITGENIPGFRAPSWEFSVNTLSILKEMGFVYDSSQMGSDKITTCEALGESSDLPEIPINWSLDDAPLWLLSLHTWGATMPAPSTAFESWSEEFLYLYEESFDNVFNLTTHPQIIGRPGRMRMYEKLVKFIKEHDDIEFVRCIDAAEDYLKNK